jgi:hypothetical protein
MIKYQTSQKGIADLVKQAGELSGVCPFTLNKSVVRPRLLCSVQGCSGKSLCPVLAHEGECDQSQCPLASDFLHIRKTCLLDVIGEKCFDWSNEHRGRMVHRGEEGGAEDWVRREALAKLRHAHERGLWLVGELGKKLGALKIE